MLYTAIQMLDYVSVHTYLKVVYPLSVHYLLWNATVGFSAFLLNRPFSCFYWNVQSWKPWISDCALNVIQVTVEKCWEVRYCGCLLFNWCALVKNTIFCLFHLALSVVQLLCLDTYPAWICAWNGFLKTCRRLQKASRELRKIV